jgi:magnesium chelatase subunit I
MNSTSDPDPHLQEAEELDQKEPVAHPFKNLRELVDYVSGKSLSDLHEEDSGLAEALPFPFFAIVGQHEMKLALILGLVNPNLGGILLIGPRGTAKSTAVRSLLDLLPHIERSACYYGCLPEDVESGGITAICPSCAKKYAEGTPLTIPDRVRLVELPLNSRLEDVVGGIDERAEPIHERMRLRRGILSHADKNILYIDEVNLLADEIVDAILDASAQGTYTVRRGQIAATYRSRFLLIGSMNPEEGRLRPQIFDRFGLRVIVQGLDNQQDRLEAYRRVQAYQINPREMIARYALEIDSAMEEIDAARKRLRDVKIPDKVAKPAIELVQKMGIDSLRAEITWFEAARAHAAADGRDEINSSDLTIVAPMALRIRRSPFMSEYIDTQQVEEEELKGLLEKVVKKSTRNPTARKSKK